MHLQSLFDQSISSGNSFIDKNKSELCCKLPVMGAVRTLCAILKSLIDLSFKECPQLYQKHDVELESNLDTQTESSSVDVQTLAGIYIPKKALKHKKDNQDHIGEPQSDLFELIGKLFVFSFTWAYGGCFETSIVEEEVMEGLVSQNITRGGNTVVSKFDALVHEIFQSSESLVHVKMPTTTDLIFSYYVDIPTSSFLQWKALVPSPKQISTKLSLLRKGLGNISSNFSSPFFKEFCPEHLSATTVPFISTLSTIQLTYLATLLNSNVMFVGKTSVGKTQFLKYLSDVLLSSNLRAAVLELNQNSNQKYSARAPLDQPTDESIRNEVSGFEYQLSKRTSSLKLQSAIESYCRRTGLSVLKPAMGKKVKLHR